MTRAVRAPAGRGGGIRGFTLVEVLVALLILTTALLVLLRLHVLTLRHMEITRQLTQANLVAGRTMAEVLGGEFPAVGVRSGNVPSEAEAPPMRWQVSVAPARPPEVDDDIPLATLHLVTVAVTWDDGLPPNRLELRTYVANTD